MLFLTVSVLFVLLNIVINIVMVDFLRPGFAQFNPPAGQPPITQPGAAQPGMMQPVPMQSVTTLPQMPGPPVSNTLNNNTLLPNFGVNTYSTATGEVRVPFQVDTSRMMAFSVIVDDEWQMFTVLDPVNQTIAVYRIALKDGKNKSAGTCQLKSVRNISADLKFYNYNGVTPQPEEVQTIIDRRNH